jgi:hypothetical protein
MHIKKEHNLDCVDEELVLSGLPRRSCYWPYDSCHPIVRALLALIYPPQSFCRNLIEGPKAQPRLGQSVPSCQRDTFRKVGKSFRQPTPHKTNIPYEYWQESGATSLRRTRKRFAPWIVVGWCGSEGTPTAGESSSYIPGKWWRIKQCDRAPFSRVEGWVSDGHWLNSRRAFTCATWFRSAASRRRRQGEGKGRQSLVFQLALLCSALLCSALLHATLLVCRLPFQLPKRIDDGIDELSSTFTASLMWRCLSQPLLRCGSSGRPFALIRAISPDERFWFYNGPELPVPEAWESQRHFGPFGPRAMSSVKSVLISE